MQRRKKPKPSHLLLADLHGLLLHLQLLRSKSFFCMPWLHPSCICCLVHLGLCCVCILIAHAAWCIFARAVCIFLCVCIWLSSMQGYSVHPSNSAAACTDETRPCAFLQQVLHIIFLLQHFAKFWNVATKHANEAVESFEIVIACATHVGRRRMLILSKSGRTWSALS